MPNPLEEFYRHSDFTVSLPSQLKWYPEGFFTKVSPTNEIEVFPMSINDEYLLKTNDALMSGSADIDIIKSCVPSCTNPEKLLYPDALALMLAVRKATTGDKFVYYGICEECVKKATEIVDKNGKQVTDPKILREQYNLDVEQQEFSFSISDKLSHMTYLEDKYEVIEDSLTFELQPLTFENYNTVNLVSYYQYNLIKLINDDSKMDIVQKKEKIYECNKKLIDAGTETIVNGIKRIIAKRTDGSIVEVTNKDEIREFIRNYKSDSVTRLSKKIEEINATGVSTVGHCVCHQCNHEWDIHRISYDISNFFAYGS